MFQVNIQTLVKIPYNFKIPHGYEDPTLDCVLLTSILESK